MSLTHLRFEISVAIRVYLYVERIAGQLLFKLNLLLFLLLLSFKVNQKTRHDWF